MAKSYLGGTEEYSGPVPAGGYKCVIESIEKGKTGPNSQVPGLMRYEVRLRITEPKKYGGSAVMDWFTIGTEDDPRAREPETWRNGGLGVKKLARLLKRAGVAAKDGDDEEWMDAAAGQEVCAHIRRETDETGQYRNRVNGDYFKESDDDFVGVGEELEAPRESRGGRRGANGKGRSEPPRGGRAARPPADDEEDEGPPRRKAKPAEEEEKPAKAKQPEPDDDDEEEEDDKDTKSAKPARGSKRMPAKDDEDDDED